MHVVTLDYKNRAHRKLFLDLPYEIYHDNPYWVPPLASEIRLLLNPNKHPFYKHSNALFLLAFQGESCIGRLAVLDNHRYNTFNKSKTAFFCLFECENEQLVAELLFQAAFDWAKSRGLNEMVGPKGFTPLDGFGLLTKGYEYRPAFGLPYNPPYYVELIEELGFKPNGECLSGYLGSNIEFPERIHELATRLRTRRGLTIISISNRRQLSQAVKYLEDLYNSSLEGTSGTYPLSKEEIETMTNQMLWLADPKLIKIIMKNERPVGFLLAYPDVSSGIQKVKGKLFPIGWLKILRELRTTDWININGAGLLPEFRGSGGTAILYSELFKSVRSNPRYQHAEIVQIGVENDKMLREMSNFGIEFYKTHRVYHKYI